MKELVDCRKKSHFTKYFSRAKHDYPSATSSPNNQGAKQTQNIVVTYSTNGSILLKWINPSSYQSDGYASNGFGNKVINQMYIDSPLDDEGPRILQ